MIIQSSTNTLESYFSTSSHNIRLPFTIISPKLSKNRRYERDGHWTQKQQLKYTIFLNFFKDIIENSFISPTIRLFDMMSDMIITRNSNQCRNHHKKMIKYQNTLTNIISNVSQKYEPKIYQEFLGKYEILIQTLIINKQKYFKKQQSNSDRIQGRNKLQTKRCKMSTNRSLYELEKGRKKEGIVILKIEQGMIRNSSEGSEQISYQQCMPQDKIIDGESPIREIDQREDLRVDISKDHQNDLKIQQMRACSSLQMQQNEYMPLPGTPSLDTQSRLIFQHHLSALEIKKKWHQQYLEFLLLQHSKQIQNVKDCEEVIAGYGQLLRSSDMHMHH